METVQKTSVSLGCVDLETVEAIFVQQDETVWCYCTSDKVDAHDPMDRVEGPFRIHSFVDDSDGERWFIFIIQCSFFSPCVLVRGDSWENAHEHMTDYCVDHYLLRIEDDDLPDYDIEAVTYSSGGVPVDMECVTGHEVALHSIHMLEV